MLAKWRNSLNIPATPKYSDVLPFHFFLFTLFFFLFLFLSCLFCLFFFCLLFYVHRKCCPRLIFTPTLSILHIEMTHFCRQSKALYQQFQTIFNIFKWSPIICTPSRSLSLALFTSQESAFYANRFATTLQQLLEYSCAVFCIRHNFFFLSWFSSPLIRHYENLFLRVFTIHTFLSCCHLFDMQNFTKRSY